MCGFLPNWLKRTDTTHDLSHKIEHAHYLTCGHWTHQESTSFWKCWPWNPTQSLKSWHRIDLERYWLTNPSPDAEGKRPKHDSMRPKQNFHGLETSKTYHDIDHGEDGGGRGSRNLFLNELYLRSNCAYAHMRMRCGRLSKKQWCHVSFYEFFYSIKSINLSILIYKTRIWFYREQRETRSKLVHS